MKLNNILKWFPVIIGTILLLVGLVYKISESPKSYDQFIAGNSFIFLVTGIEAIILNFAFNQILDENENK